MGWRPSVSDSAICPLFLTLCFSFHLFLKQAGTHSRKFSLAPWVLHEFFCSEECLNMDLFSSSAEWLRLDLLDFSCVLQVISKHNSFWHSTCAQWRSAYFCSLCWGMQGRHFPRTSGWNVYHESLQQQQQQQRNPEVCFNKIYRPLSFSLSSFVWGNPLDHTTSKVYPTLFSYIWEIF